ncbi:MAG TPA: hypothetical protein VMA36_01530 [Candidatus Limnocylindria bacterium]|jgi:hypothetical protein|nr:hypothetical protein [Candidatus Limnocylindria bacterium]
MVSVRLRRIAPIQAGVVAAVVYGLIGIPLALIYMAMLAASPQTRGLAFAAILAPVAYAILGFIGGALTAWLFNVAAGWVGGVELTFDQTPVADRAA